MGKELFADYGHRVSAALIKLALSPMAHDLLESELFGHERVGAHRPAPREAPAPARRHRRTRGDEEGLGVAGIALTIVELDVRTGQRSAWREIPPEDPAGLGALVPMLAGDKLNCAADTTQVPSALHLASGLRLADPVRAPLARGRLIPPAGSRPCAAYARRPRRRP